MEVAVVALGAVVAFWGISFLLVMTPGADWAYMITTGLQNRPVIPAASGLLSGYLALTVVVAAGVGTLVAASPVVLAVLTAAGAAYLIWLGAAGVAHPAQPAPAAVGTPRPSWCRQAVKGAGISGLNPKALLLFLALLPQFTRSASAWPLTAQIMFLGAVHILNCAVIYSGVGVGARVVLAARPSLARAVSRLSGTAMVAIGVLLVVHQFAG